MERGGQNFGRDAVMLVGLDFDNTIVCYDRLFHRLAVERSLITSAVPVTKTSVRDALRAAGHEHEWTELQGLGYGPRIVDAEPFAGVKEFLATCASAGIQVVVISHKTLVPFRGPPYDLHAAAHSFLTTHGFYDSLLSQSNVHLEPTLAAKLERIDRLECDLFVDDLPEVLHEADFPAHVGKVLFDPADVNADHPSYTRVNSWHHLSDVVIGMGVHQ